MYFKLYLFALSVSYLPHFASRLYSSSKWMSSLSTWPPATELHVCKNIFVHVETHVFTFVHFKLIYSQRHVPLISEFKRDCRRSVSFAPSSTWQPSLWNRLAITGALPPKATMVCDKLRAASVSFENSVVFDTKRLNRINTKHQQQYYNILGHGCLLNTKLHRQNKFTHTERGVWTSLGVYYV